MSLQVLGGLGGSLMPLGGLGDNGNLTPAVPAWAGWRTNLSIDATGKLIGSAAVVGVVPGDGWNVYLSGIASPATTISNGTMYVDTQQGSNAFTVAGLVSIDGSAGTFLVEFHASDANTALLTGGIFYKYSLVLVDSTGVRFTPVNGAWLAPKASLAV